jgi:transcription elongation factor Elf1
LARRRRKRIKQVRRVRRPSRYFQCPRCGAMTLTIDFKKLDSADHKLAIARCGTCHLYCELEVPAVYDRVDVYNRISDLAYEGRLEECSKPYQEPEGEEAEEPTEGEGEEGPEEGQ